MGKRMKRLLWFIWFIPITLSGQRSISGRITDAADGSPIPAVTVFLANTAVGISTDTDGKYRLSIPGEGSYQLKVSHVGYQPVTKDIEPGNKSVEFNVALQAIELGEVTVSSKVKFRRADISLFWKTILGKNPSAKTIQATNPEAVYYYYNPETKILKVTCREPLQIVNYETGYRIQYFLDRFTHDYNTGFTDWHYQSVFKELEPQNPGQKDTWNKNRKEVYDISLTKFIKSLYNNTLLNDGFVLTDFNLDLVDRDKILQTNPVTKSKTIDVDGVVLLICYGKPVTGKDLEILQSIRQISQQTSAQPISSATYVAPSSMLDNRIKIINLLQGNSIRIFPDGTFTSALSMGRVNKSESLMGLAMRLPVEYIPDGFTPSSEAIAENTDAFDSIARHFNTQLNLFPQEKLHLHTDRDYYVPGEKIWFKAYVADAHTHTPLDSSRYVYAELISPADTVVSRVMIRPENGMYYGHIFLSEIIPEGNYTLRAYTRYMENLGDDYFFKKNIRIGNLSSSQFSVSSSQRKNVGNKVAGTSVTLTQNDYDVSFFPEGRNLVEGVWNKVAFKALNRDGTPAVITGKIIDETNAEITSVQTLHAGMGVFAYVPESGKRYFLKCRNGNGLEKQFDLPKSDPRACALTVVQNNNRISVGVRKSPQSSNSQNNPLYLLAQCRGEALYFSEWNNKNEYVSFSAEGFPSGIIQFILFDARMNPLSERLVFSKNFANDIENLEFQTDKVSYGKREKVIATIQPPLTPPKEGNIPSLLGRAGVGLSVSITDDRDIAPDSTTTILSSLLLTSELKGYIENPAWYLQDNPASETALDYLMMTHGWRRYNVPEVVKGNLEIPNIPFQTGQRLAGSVKSNMLSRPVSDSEVFIMAGQDTGLTSTDESGRFLFQGFEYPDSTSFFIQALGKKSSRLVKLTMDNELFPTPVHVVQSPCLTPTLSKGEGVETDDYPSLQTNDFIAKAEQRAKYDESMRMIYLDEVLVTAPRVSRPEPRIDFYLNKSAAITVRKEQFEQRHPIHVSDILRGIAGVRVSSNGNITLSQGGRPIVLIDGVIMEWPDTMYFAAQSPVEMVNVSSVESIDVIMGVGASILGVRGSGGAISITTKRGADASVERNFDNTAIFTPLGYQKPVEFYSPKYETLEAKNSTIPDYRTTIFWKPDIVISEDQEEATFEFYTSDFPTTYSVVIEGLTTDGKIVRQVERIKVE